MCLNKVTEEFDPPDPAIKIGYKCFYATRTNQSTMCYSAPLQKFDKFFNVGEWTEDNNIGRVEHIYNVGFHIFREYNDAAVYTLHFLGSINSICKVEYTNTVATGYQQNMPVVVARKIRIIEECV